MRHYGSTLGRALLAAMLSLTVVFAASCAKPSISQTAQSVVDSMVKGDFKAATKDFDSTMETQMPAESLKQIWTQLTAQYGGFKGCAGVREAEEQGAKVAFVTCEFGKGNLDLKVVFDGSNQISGLWLVPSQRLPESKLP